MRVRRKGRRNDRSERERGGGTRNKSKAREREVRGCVELRGGVGNEAKEKERRYLRSALNVFHDRIRMTACGLEMDLHRIHTQENE